MEVVLYQNSVMLYCSCVAFRLGMQKNILIWKLGRLCRLLRVLNFINFLVLPHNMYDESFFGWMWLFFSAIKERKNHVEFNKVILWRTDFLERESQRFVSCVDWWTETHEIPRASERVSVCLSLGQGRVYWSGDKKNVNDPLFCQLFFSGPKHFETE